MMDLACSCIDSARFARTTLVLHVIGSDGSLCSDSDYKEHSVQCRGFSHVGIHF